MNNTTQHNIETRRKRDTASLKTELTLDWSDMTPEAIRDLAVKTVVIKLQQPRTRAKTDAELRAALPETMTVRVADIEWGPRRGPKDPVAAAKKAMGALTKEQLIALAREQYPDDKLFND